MSGYQFWQDSLAGLKPKMFTDDPQLGFYRKPIKERNAKGNNKRVGWAPVAIFMADGAMIARVGTEDGGKDLTGDDLNEIWSYVAGNAISEGNYREVARHGKKWWDEQSPPEIPAADRDVAQDDNAPPQVLTDKDHAAAIDNAISAALKTVTNEAEAAQALGSKNRIAELRLAADKAGKAFYDPPFREYKRLHGLWSPMVARADTAEKALQKVILTFREKERQRIAAEQAATDARQRENDEANERAAQRSIAAGISEQPPEVVEIEKPVAAAPIVATYGSRGLKEEMKTFLDAVTDFDQVYAYFKNTAEVKTFLIALATAAVKSGKTVPGTTTRQGLI